jgi:adenylyltransferase/sulfurtransferase
MSEERLRSLEEENKRLKEYILKLEENSQKQSTQQENGKISSTDESLPFYAYDESSKLLSNEQISRYSRHLLLPEISVNGQAGICNGSVLVVGAGGLGAPCLLYLAAMGVGRLGIVDFDRVDVSNLHRQVIHSEKRRDQPKVMSAALSISNLNSKTRVDTYDEPFDETNALRLVSQYDVVIDASDNVATRYMVNDACILGNKPLVSASAVRFEGQLTVYNYGKDCPCYRCLFPEAPPPETVTNCADGGVCGVVPGIMGCLQAMEVIKILIKSGGGGEDLQILNQRMLLFQGKNGTFRTVQLRKKVPTCALCGENPTITKLERVGAPVCAAPTDHNKVASVLSSQNRITAKEFKDVMEKQGEPGKNYLLVDVREEVQYNIASLPGAINMPLKKLPKQWDELKNMITEINGGDHTDFPVYVMCRRGIASVSATKLLLQEGFGNVKNVDGGVTEWRKEVDYDFPSY